ncbi:MAG: hypothetical protein N2C14_00970, partial [Planctomycetales bacterium]
MTEPTQAPRASGLVGVEYLLEGGQSASAVAKGEAELAGVALYMGDAPATIHADARTALDHVDGLRRVYPNAVLARTVERRFNLTSACAFDDLSAMKKLLDHAGVRSRGESLDSPMEPALRLQTACESHSQLVARLHQEGLYSVYVNIELPVVDCVVDMTIHGLIVDVARLARIEATESVETEIRLRQVQEIAGSLDPASDKAVRDFLYEQCGLAPPFRTPGNEKPACKLALQRLADEHEVVRPIQNYRAHRNVVEAARTLRPHVGADSVVRGKLDPLGARTGRFTCKSPNLLGLDKRLREAVCAGTGCALVEA